MIDAPRLAALKPTTLSLVLLMPLALSSLNSKAMGAVWLLLLLLGIWAGLQAWRAGQRPNPSMGFKVWVGVALTTLLLKTIVTLYWSDPWSERHGELRIFLGAIGIYFIAASKNPPPPRLLAHLAYALSVSSLLGLLWVVAYGRSGVTTHPIPWAGGMAMVSAWLLAVGLKSDFSALERRIWMTGGLLAMLAVLSSRSRGAFGIVIWWIVICAHHSWSRRHPSAPTTTIRGVYWPFKKSFALALTLIATVWALSYSPVLQRPVEAIREAFVEFEVSKSSPAAGANSSVGARMFMWQKSLGAIQASPWFGYGREGRLKLLREWADEANSSEIHQLGHLHSEYLNQLIDHGFWGVASQLSLLLGLAWICWLLRSNHETTAALALSGVAFIHLTSSIFNVNFAHNYYTASLSSLIGLSLWLTELTPRRGATNKPHPASKPL